MARVDAVETNRMEFPEPSPISRILFMGSQGPEARAVDTAAAEEVVARFGRLVQRDGGNLVLRAIDGGTMTVAYESGTDLTCDADSCVLRSAELQQMMSEVLERKGSHLRVEVVSEPVPGAAGEAE
jgi:hypothetical protein